MTGPSRRERSPCRPPDPRLRPVAAPEGAKQFQQVKRTDPLRLSAARYLFGAKSPVGALLVGSIPGVLVGSSLTLRGPDRALRLALGCVLVLSGVKLVELPHADAIVLAAVGAFVLAALVTLFSRMWWVRTRCVPSPKGSG